VTVLLSPASASELDSVTRIEDDDNCLTSSAADVASEAPHSSQNLAPGLFLEPQFGHEAAIGAAHSLQTSRPRDSQRRTLRIEF
jgi:hypothetical protein